MSYARSGVEALGAKLTNVRVRCWDVAFAECKVSEHQKYYDSWVGAACRFGNPAGYRDDAIKALQARHEWQHKTKIGKWCAQHGHAPGSGFAKSINQPDDFPLRSYTPLSRSAAAAAFEVDVRRRCQQRPAQVSQVAAARPPLAARRRYSGFKLRRGMRGLGQADTGVWAESFCLPQSDVCYERADLVEAEAKQSKMTAGVVAAVVGLAVGALGARMLGGKR
jgi:hypothetical protein